MKITSDSTIKDILKIKKGSQVLEENGVPCLSCPKAALELDTLTIGDVSQIYGLNLEKILGQLNHK